MEPEKYADRRAEMYWTVRELLDPDIRNNPTPIALPPDEDMIGDLSCVKYKVDGHGRIRVESKDDIKKRIGHSPDDGDAVVLAFAPAKGRPQAVPVITIDGNSTWRSR
jgi:hypothetical protein